MKHIKYKLSDWIEAKRKTKYKALINGVKQGLQKHNTPNAQALLKVINSKQK